MGFLETAEPGFIGADSVTSLAFGIIRLLGYGAMGIVIVGALLSALCDFFEGREWRHARRRSGVRHLMS